MNIEIFDIISNFNEKIIQIGGKSTTGKTTLAMTLLNNIIEQYLKSSGNGTVIWIDSNNSFSKDRFSSICQNPKYLNHIMYRAVTDLSDQQTAIELIYNLAKSKAMNNISALVVDDISYHVRNIESKMSYGQFSVYLEAFFENQIKKILQIQQLTNCYIILVHQMSVKKEKSDIVFSDLYKQINSLFIDLHSDGVNRYATMRNETIIVKLKYTLTSQGITTII